jgi:voltage-gated potassium channel
MPNHPAHTDDEPQDQERWQALETMEDWLEGPVQWLGLIWLVLLIVEYIYGLNEVLTALVYMIWGIFLLDFVVRLYLAPDRITYLRRNWFTVITLALPGMRVFLALRALPLLRLVSGLRGLQLVRIVGSLNRGMHTLKATMGRRKFGYVVALTVIVTAAGSAGMWALENQAIVATGFRNFSDALWWTAMIMTTMGSEYWPQTYEGRVLGFLLSLYAFSVFGYVTATLATVFIGQEAQNPESEVAGAEELRRLNQQMAALREEVRRLREELQGPPEP